MSGRPIPRPHYTHYTRENCAPRSAFDAELMHVNSAARVLWDQEQRLEHQVARARFAGASWAQIGAELGVSKQAAAQRFGDNHDCRALGCGTERL
jgi:hypothetical protein